MAKQTKMAPQRFWALIDAHVVHLKNGAIDATALGDELATLPEATILAFSNRCGHYFGQSYTWPLWGAAYLIHYGAPDDTFDYFRSWLIGRGRKTYESAMRDPDSLADVATPEALDDVVYSAGQTAYEAVSLQDMPDNEIPWPELKQDFDFEDREAMVARYPRLSKKFRDW